MVDVNQYPHDTNLTLNCMFLALCDLATDHKLTPTIYVQLDNTCRENKNKYFMGCMAVLVARGLVKEVIMSFLMVGHTHEGIYMLIVSSL